MRSSREGREKKGRSDGERGEKERRKDIDCL
jgi:hypothetical protein